MALSQLDLELAGASLTESIQLSQATGQRLAIARGIEAAMLLRWPAATWPGAVKLAGAASALRRPPGMACPARPGPGWRA